jgi:hypothetical protein
MNSSLILFSGDLLDRCGDKIGRSEALTMVAASRLVPRPALAFSGGRGSCALYRVQRLLNPPGGTLDSSKLVAAGVILSALSLVLCCGWNRSASAENRASKAQGDAKSSVEKEASKREATGIVLRGKEALIRIVRQKPEWGKEIDGLQIGLSRTGDKSTFKSNEVVPLEFYVRNNSDKPVVLTCYRHFTNGDLAPTVFDAADREVATNRKLMSGIDPTYDVTLAPHETIVCQHDGLNLAEIIEPSIEEHSTEQHIRIFIGRIGDKKVGEWTKFETGKVKFEIANVVARGN